MRAACVERYGPPEVVRVVDLPDPEPGKGEVLVRVVAAAVSSGDARIRGARFPGGFAPLARLALGVRGPRRPVLGIAFSGVVEAVGPEVEGLAPGDAVAGMTGRRLGAHAELAAVPAARAVPKPPGVTHDDAAGVLFGGTTALNYLRDRGRVGPGASVLVIGAAGAVGTNAVQLARGLGATVVAVTSGRNAALVHELGADRVVDYTTTDVTALPDRYDAVLDCVGTLTIHAGRRLLAPDGRLLLVAATLGQTVRARGAVQAGVAPERRADVEHLLRLVDEGALAVVHDRAFALDDVVEAHRLVDSGRKRGNVLLRMD